MDFTMDELTILAQSVDLRIERLSQEISKTFDPDDIPQGTAAVVAQKVHRNALADERDKAHALRRRIQDQLFALQFHD